MARRKIYTKKLTKELDFYHLAKEFYLYIIRYPELETDNEWAEIKKIAEDYLVEVRCSKDYLEKVEAEDYRDFLRFLSRLEMKFYDDEKEFIFNEKDKVIFLNNVRKSDKI